MAPTLPLLEPLLGHADLLAGDADGAEEAGMVIFVAGSADLLDLNEQGVAVAIEGDVLHGLHVPAGFAFHPKFLAGAAPEMRFAGSDGRLEGSAIHPGHHQDAAGGLLLHDRGDKAVT